ncbi:MAG TPA: PKD domain-containing protein, partial [Chitinophagaceae bacterium]|nr:PKD domain-containing protein [Chitinophagaceae bacterium]
MSAGTVYHRKIIFTIITLLLQCRLSAQLSAAFTATPLAGCSPIVVQFTDQSTGNPTQWKWDLGNGVISFLQNPSTTYFNGGTYTVKLVVRNGISADSIVKSQYITVFAAPVVNFIASDTSGCFPFPVQFTDLSTSPNGTISSWLWDFGDGAVSALRNPQHVYTTSGNFTVTLKITNSNGCFKLLSHPQYIDVTDGVRAGFTNTSPAQCSVPATISFTNTSTGGGSLNFTWDFGDGTGSNLANPVHVYSAGTYSVTLVTESALGCRDTLVKTNLISIGAINSQFNSPDSVCLDQPFTITNTTTPVPIASHWDFGDGTSSTEINPVKKYTSAGIFTIKLVNTFSGCMDSIIKAITVRPGPATDFSANQTQYCTVPFTANFINQTTGNNTYLWNFGDGATSTDANPVHIYTVAGTYSVTLIALNETGCSDTLTKPD